MRQHHVTILDNEYRYKRPAVLVTNQFDSAYRVDETVERSIEIQYIAIMYKFLLICIIGLVAADPTVEKQAIESAEKAVASYKHAIDDVILKLNYPEKDLLSRFQIYYSSATGQRAGELKTTLMNGGDNFFNAKQNIYNFCGESMPILEGYSDLLEIEEAATERRKQLADVLDLEIQELQEGDTNLKTTSSSFEASLNKTSDLLDQLESDYSPESEYFKAFIKAAEIEHSANKTAIATLERIANLTAIAVKEIGKVAVDDPIVKKFLEAYDMTLPPPEDFVGTFTIKLQAKFAEVKEFYTNLKTKVTGTKAQLDTTDAKLKQDIGRLESLKAALQKETSVQMPADVQSAIKTAINKFNIRCKAFRIIATF